MANIPLDDRFKEQGPLLYLYRYDDNPYVDPADYSLTAYKVLRLTPKGCWIKVSSYEPKEKWVPLDRHPGAYFAFVSLEQAIYSYMKRKEWHVRRLAHKLDQAKQRLQLAKMHHAEGRRPDPDDIWSIPLIA